VNLFLYDAPETVSVILLFLIYCTGAVFLYIELAVICSEKYGRAHLS